MKILAIYRHYLPDTAPYGRILSSILEHQAAQGHEVTVVTAQPSYNDIRQEKQPWQEKIRGVQVKRIRLLPERKNWQFVRAFNFAWFLLRAVIHAISGPRYDLVLANSHPPVLMGLALQTIHKLRGTPYIYHLQDLHPEAAKLAGDLEPGWLYDRLLNWETATCNSAQRVVVLSQDMADSLTSRGVPANCISIVNNPPLTDSFTSQPKLPPPLDEHINTVRLLFAGNLGRFQGLERLIAAARLIAGRVPFQLIFMGEGSAKRDLCDLAGELLGRRIVFLPQQSPETAQAAMRVCDYGIISLLPEVYRFAYPSKSMTYWSAGCPVIALVEPQSELAQTIEHHDLGVVASCRSVCTVAETLMNAILDRHHWTPERRRLIEAKCHELFGFERMHAAWDGILRDRSTNHHIKSERRHASAAA